MSENESVTDADGGISDEQLPEDLQPTEENPLAQPLDEDADEVDELDVKGGKGADEWDDEDHED